MNIINRILLLLLLSQVLTACSAQPTMTPASNAIATTDFAGGDQPMYWWYARYKMIWPQDTAPDLSVDLLIADKIVKPVLNDYRNKIKYWRFHRRAAPDDAGHSFSFIFYTDKISAAAIYAQLEINPLISELLKNNIIERTRMDDLENNSRTAISAVSDPDWPAEIQLSWPAYIMGVCSMWLQLIEQHADTADSTTMDALLKHYQDVHAEITRLWESQAQHAFLHHLSAIFGYEPMLIKKAIQF